MVLYYDSREDHTIGLLTKTCPSGQTCTPFGQFFESRLPVPDAGLPGPFAGFLSDTGLFRRRTLDVRKTEADPRASPQFGPSVRVSNYSYGTSAAYNASLGLPSDSIVQLQFNPENLRMFALGTLPFIGDYIDYVGPLLSPNGNGWSFVAPSNTQVARAVWRGLHARQQIGQVRHRVADARVEPHRRGRQALGRRRCVVLYVRRRPRGFPGWRTPNR
jgi:hypothetical protein